jgi:hypothetical protein
MSKEPIDIALDYEGIHYKGWATPSSTKNDQDQPRSWHVILNETMFGNLSQSDGNWVIDEQRPAGMVEKVGQVIEALLNEKGT